MGSGGSLGYEFHEYVLAIILQSIPFGSFVEVGKVYSIMAKMREEKQLYNLYLAPLWAIFLFVSAFARVFWSFLSLSRVFRVFASFFSSAVFSRVCQVFAAFSTFHLRLECLLHQTFRSFT